jgi:hypothetical protein
MMPESLVSFIPILKYASTVGIRGRGVRGSSACTELVRLAMAAPYCNRNIPGEDGPLLVRSASLME